MNYTYILRCADGSLYTGATIHRLERVAPHLGVTAAMNTNGTRPVELVYYETFQTKEEAMRREYAVKRMSRRDKLALIAGQASHDTEKHAPEDAC